MPGSWKGRLTTHSKKGGKCTSCSQSGRFHHATLVDVIGDAAATESPLCNGLHISKCWSHAFPPQHAHFSDRRVWVWSRAIMNASKLGPLVSWGGLYVNAVGGLRRWPTFLETEFNSLFSSFHNDSASRWAVWRSVFLLFFLSNQISASMWCYVKLISPGSSQSIMQDQVTFSSICLISFGFNSPIRFQPKFHAFR